MLSIIARARSSRRRCLRRRRARRRPTIWPSARNSTPWAYDAARGSWVTITTVWPCSSATRRRSSSTWRPELGRGRRWARRRTGPRGGRAAPGRSPRAAAGRRTARGAPARLVLETDRVQRAQHRLAVDGVTGQPPRQSDVVVCTQGVEQVVRLEHETHRGPAQPGQRGLAEVAEGGGADHHLAPGGPVEPGGDLEQRGLAGPRGPITAVKLPWANVCVTPRSACTSPARER